MDIIQQNIIKYSELILNQLLKYKEIHPEFTFSLRQKDFAKPDSPKRLENGQWFQGSNYIYVPLFKIGDTSRKIKTVGFILNFDADGNIQSNSITISFKGGVTNKNEINFHKKLAKELNVELNIQNHGSFFFSSPTAIEENLDYYLNTVRPIALKLLSEFNLTDRYVISENEFQKNFTRISEIRNPNSTNYWIFQGNPKLYDAVNALKNNAVRTWTVSAHKNKIKKGDKFILWLTGVQSGCYGIGSVDTDVVRMLEDTIEMEYYLNQTKQVENTRVKISIEDNLYDSPILWETIKDLEVFKTFYGGTQGTNFTLTKDEYDYFKKNATSNNQSYNTMSDLNLNQILFGPPGTGKTYNSINEALRIVDNDFYTKNKGNRKKITDRFKELLIKNTEENKGQIAFCTFHQSFSYEDFVEGIKPKTTDDKKVYYDIEPGVFLNICELANSFNSTLKVKNEGKISWTEEQFRRASFYKISLGEAKNPNDKEIYEFCRDNGYIAIGFGQENDFSGLSESEITEKCTELELEPIAGNQMYTFIHYLKKGNYVMISYGNKYVRALGKVVGDYEYWDNSPIRYNHFRKVEWIFTDELIPIDEIYERGLSQKTMYKIDESALRMNFFINDGQSNEVLESEKEEEKNYVIIIDEINRGNVSSIFGELITLIEKDKRAGADEELSVILPYSKKEFKVPKNVYLIGTMNTADKSIEALDTALRRRFSFIEKAPNPELLKSEGALKATKGKIDKIDIVELLTTINNRLEKLIDKDHKIGHSYFMSVSTPEDLRKVFKDKVIPLLEEYFFGDLGKIGLVLGESFIKKSKNDDVKFAKFTEYDSLVTHDLQEKAVYLITPENNWNFETIYDDKVTSSDGE